VKICSRISGELGESVGFWVCHFEVVCGFSGVFVKYGCEKNVLGYIKMIWSRFAVFGP